MVVLPSSVLLNHPYESLLKAALARITHLWLRWSLNPNLIAPFRSGG